LVLKMCTFLALMIAVSRVTAPSGCAVSKEIALCKVA